MFVRKILSTLYTRNLLNFSSNVINMEVSSEHGPIGKSISSALYEKLKPTHIELVNESYMHNVPKGAESHFKVLVVSEKFDGLSLIKRHRLVNDIVKEALGDFVHALSIIAKAPKEYDATAKLEPSPACRGGFGK